MKCGLLGRHLGHSYSPYIHSRLGDYCYELFEREPEEIEAFLKNGDFSGINVTVPYKKDVIPYLDELTPVARQLGAVNTVVRRGEKLIGHNTDYFGFMTMVKESGLEISGKKVLVLGSGGASNTATAVLEELNAHVVVISRQRQNNYTNLHLHADASVIVNTTPVGMYPNAGNTPVSLDLFPVLEGGLDVVYNPARTKLLLDAEKRGLVAMNGLLMLVAQAKEAAQWFTQAPITEADISTIYRDLQRRMENIILIGMPGSGKTTVGKCLAQKTGRDFVDADEELIRYAGRSIPEIFARDGEAVFRQLETYILSQIGQKSNLVIATGGGCVTQAQNYPLLHQNGTIFCLNRDISKLPTDGRPLSQQNKADEMYRIRKPLYETFADNMIDNNGDPDDAVRHILLILEENT